jgi:hypothetical protein
MSIAILAFVALAAVARGAWVLHRLWRTLPQTNQDFGLV